MNKDRTQYKRLDTKDLFSNPEYKKNYDLYIEHKNFDQIQDTLESRGLGFPQRVAILSNIISENGGRTTPHGNGFEGLIGWGGSRKANLPKDLAGQLHKLMEEIHQPNKNTRVWNDGGSGTGVATGEEMRNLFLNTNNTKQATKAFTKGLVRPPKFEPRVALSELLKKHMVYKQSGGKLSKSNEYSKRINLDDLRKKWKALKNIDFEAIPDTTFTRDKTGVGSIDYFSAEKPEGIPYPNGYHKKHPRPGKDVILYNPNLNDEQDIKLDALHIMPKDATYDVLNTEYRNAARGTDVEWNARNKYKEDVKTYGADRTDPYEKYFNNEADGLLRNMFIEGTPEYIESKNYHPNKKELEEWNKPLLGHISEIKKYLETGKRPRYILPELIVTPYRNK